MKMGFTTEGAPRLTDVLFCPQNGPRSSGRAGFPDEQVNSGSTRSVSASLSGSSSANQRVSHCQDQDQD